MNEPKAIIREVIKDLAIIRDVVGCTSPRPLRCPYCRVYNKGWGLDYCRIGYLLVELKHEEL